VQFVNIDAVFGAKDGYDQSQADGYLGRRYGDNEEDYDLPVQIIQMSRESDEGEVRRI
jgi:hypothetical protein